MTASDFVHRQLWFTPFPTEPIGWMTEQCGDDLFLFSSDYPHPEGTKDPIARFESNMDGMDDAATRSLLPRQLRRHDGLVAGSLARQSSTRRGWRPST